MSLFIGKTAAITGAGSGIGRALACALAERGAAALALSDIDAATAEETAEMVRARGAAASAHRVDVAELASVQGWAEDTAATFGTVHQLYNNAGTAAGAYPFLDGGAEAFDRVMAINLGGVVNGTRAFLPLLIASGEGALVNISSLNGLMAQGEMTGYCTSKFAVRGFTEAIRVEMLMQDRPVQVVVVHPGGVRTNIAAAARASAKNLTPEEQARADARRRLYEEKLLRMPPEAAAAEILDGIARGRCRIVVTSKAKVLDKLVRLMPERYPKLIADWQRKAFR